jgi:hypothetical protein
MDRSRRRGIHIPISGLSLALFLAIGLGTALGGGCSDTSGSGAAADDASAPGTGTMDAGPLLDSTMPVRVPDAHVAGADARPSDASVDALSTDGSNASDGGTGGTGITWPPGGSFPIFAVAEQLDVADVTAIGADAGETVDLKLLFTTLQGLVNRTKPRIYVKDTAVDDQEGATFWLDKFNVPETPVADPMTLLTKYASEIGGIVIYDPSVVDTINLATTIAGIEGGVVASPALATTLGAAPYNLKTLVDVRTLGLKTNLDVYNYELANYASKASTRLIIGLDPTDPAKADCLRDYAVAIGAAVVWLDSTQSAQLNLLTKFLANLDSNAPYLGWWVSEPSGVGTSAQYRVPVFAADWSRNLTVFGGVPRTINPPTPPAPPTLDTTKAYVAIFMSDGDNLQENQHLIPLKWKDPNRGKVPMSWTTQPALVDVAPVILDYYYSTATPNDVMVSGPSGLGYTYPQQWPQTPTDSFADYSIRSANYLERAGLNVITVWNNGVLLTASTTQANDYATNMPHLLGVTDQLGTGGAPTIIGGKLPFLVFSSGYAESETDLENGINAQLAGWNKANGPLFVAVQGDMNNASNTPTAFMHVQQYYAAGGSAPNPDVVFVRGDHLFQLIRAQNGLSMNP